MVRSYLRYVEMTEMILRRLTKTQKNEILEAYRSGDNTNLIAKNYNCTPNTINRTVKNLLSEPEYSFLKKNRAKISNKNEKLVNDKTVKLEKDLLEKEDLIVPLKENVREEDSGPTTKESFRESDFDQTDSTAIHRTDNLDVFSHSKNTTDKNFNMEANNQTFDNNFKEIAPLISNFDFELDKQKSDFEILNYESLPESVYMIVDKKVELELQLISDLPEWSFLPESELKRNAILLFINQRSAKRICSKNQRVIKIPNTKIFKLLKPYLVSKGITRLILEESIIGLDD